MNQVARKIKLSGNQLCLLVLDGEEYEQVVAQGQNLRGLASVSKGEGCKPPRLCHITRDPVHGLGLNFTPVEGSTTPGNRIQGPGRNAHRRDIKTNLFSCFCSTGEKGHFSVSLVGGGAAEKAGVCSGDRLVWMDGAAVSDLTYSAVSRMV